MLNIEGLILAGGMSSRMGQDKALMCRDHRDMFAYIDDQLSALKLNNINISRNASQIPRLSPYKVIADQVIGQGPLGGIHAAAQCIHADGLLIVPIDMPFITSSDLKMLITVGRMQRKPVYFDDCYLPLFLPLNDEVRHYLNDVLSGKIKQRSVKAMCRYFDAIPLQPKHHDHLVNTNTPQQWHQAKEYLAQLERA